VSCAYNNPFIPYCFPAAAAAAAGIRRRVSFRSSMPPGVTLARDGVTLFGSGGQPLACGLKLDRNGEPVTDQGHPLPEGEALAAGSRLQAGRRAACCKPVWLANSRRVL
jgi:hypothetical protein